MTKRTIGIALVVSGSVAVALLVTRPPVLFGQAGRPEIILYSGEGFTGRELRVQGTLVDLPCEENADGTLFNWNDRVESIVVVSGAWRLYQHGRLNTRLDDTPLAELDVRAQRPAGGWSAVVAATAAGPVEIPDLPAAGLSADISSLELISEDHLPEWTWSLRR